MSESEYKEQIKDSKRVLPVSDKSVKVAVVQTGIVSEGVAHMIRKLCEEQGHSVNILWIWMREVQK